VKVGDPVAVIYGRLVRLGRIKELDATRLVASFRGHVALFFVHERGITWAHGWHTDEAQAMITAYALSPPYEPPQMAPIANAFDLLQR
jgi:hypothetical protein